MVEKWKDIVKYKGFYQISNLRHTRSIARVIKGRRYKSKILKPYCKPNGYLEITLSNNGIQIKYYVHRLVLETFIGPCPNGLQCCHYDGLRNNNNLNNLRWDTPSNDCLDKKRHGTLKCRAVKRGDGKKFESIAEAARQTKCSASNINQVCLGTQKTAAKFKWEYC